MTVRTLSWLRESLKAIDRVYFDDALAAAGVRIVWAPWKKPGTTFWWGYYELEEKRICVNRALAWPWVPGYVVNGTIYHEALHAVYGPEHDERFALAEQRYVHHAKAEVWETENFNAMLAAGNPFRRVPC